MGYIYKITNKINGKVYIGQTKKTIEERFQEHLKKAKIHTNRYLYDAMNKYGYENFIVSQIEKCPDNNLDEKEIFWIAFYQSNNKLYGYNMTAGGGGGNTWINNPYKKETSKRLSQANKGKKHKMSNEWKQNITQSNKEKKTILINKNDLEKDIKSFMSIEDICKKYNFSRKTFYNKCKEFFNATPTEIRGDKLKHSNTMKITIDKKQLHQLLLQEKSLEEMAQFFQVSKETVRRSIVEYYGKNLRDVRKDVKQQK